MSAWGAATTVERTWMAVSLGMTTAAMMETLATAMAGVVLVAVEMAVVSTAPPEPVT